MCFGISEEGLESCIVFRRLWAEVGTLAVGGTYDDTTSPNPILSIQIHRLELALRWLKATIWLKAIHHSTQYNWIAHLRQQKA